LDKAAFVALASVMEQAKVRASITNSMSNATTIGFKESFEAATSAIKVEGIGSPRFVPALVMQDVVKLKPGYIIETGRGLDVAMNDSTVLGIQAVDGTIGFTRRGDLRINGSGLIENMAGQVVLGEGGTITAPEGKLLSVAPDGRIFATSPTEPNIPAEEVGQLMLRDASETTLVRREDGLFTPADPDQKGEDFDSGPLPASVRGGALEGSNVSVIDTMVRLMDFTRQFELQIKMIKEIQNIDKSGSSLMKNSG
tara:strand:+ start:13511 stop:14272 length:762 start_codon:yes stop_codon:yes gene_type:complete